MGDIATSLARWTAEARDADFPALARARAVDAITDCLACMYAGSREPLGPMLRNVIGVHDAHPGGALLVGLDRYATPADAALYNGTVAHALDYDDTNHPAYAHPSATIVPALLACAGAREGAPPTGADLVTAYILGIEVIGKLGRALNTAHYIKGWHATATFGTLAAAVTASRLLGLDQPRTVMALGIAASAASGLRANFGTMVKPLHAGYAARNGVLAALLAREGFTASEDALEHRFGYVNVFNHKVGFDLAPLTQWGESPEILSEYGLALKPYPSCGATHTGIEAALLLRDAIGRDAPKRIRAGVSEMAFNPLIHVQAATGLEGKFSLHYCLAAALLDGEVNLATFTDARAADVRIRDLIDRTTMEVDERVRTDPEFATVVEIETVTGARHEKLVPLAIGKPARWFPKARLRAKFDDCAGLVLRETRLAPVFESIQGMDNRNSAAAWCESLRAAA